MADYYTLQYLVYISDVRVFAFGTYDLPCVVNGKKCSTVTKDSNGVTLNFSDSTQEVISSSGVTTLKYNYYFFPVSTAVWLDTQQYWSMITFDLSSLVTDRADSDVTRAKQLLAKGYANMTVSEKAEWDAGLKGAWNATDFTRIENASAYLSKLGKVLQYDVADISQYFRPWSIQQYATYRSSLVTFANAFNIGGAVTFPQNTFNMTARNANFCELSLRTLATNVVSKIGAVWNS